MGWKEPSMGWKEPSMGWKEPSMGWKEPSMGWKEPSMGWKEHYPLNYQTNLAVFGPGMASEEENLTPDLLFTIYMRMLLDWTTAIYT
ncbi:hypothetical protein K3495_g2567 [Podosphaera aphanis]|nr:hypothetical protein K3495_g2567 [Podosphaera aphanis]